MESNSEALVKRNKNLLWQALLFYLDSGLNYLKVKFVDSSSTSISKMTNEQIYDFVVRQNIRKLIKSNIREVILTATEFILNEKSQDDPDYYFDKLIERKYHVFAKNDMILLHSRKEHPAYSELQTISKLIFRIGVFQSIQLLKCKDENVKTYEELVRTVYKTHKATWAALNSILSMFDRMIDIFENNLDIISIPFYRATFSLRDFKYVRILYEYALNTLDEELQNIFS